MTLPAETVLFTFPQWMDGRESAFGPSELFFSCLAAAIITVAVYLPWYLRQKKSEAQKDQG